ncbi:MAG: CehA/McbA family metallohydrolase [Pyrinomonadaceae bacterium]|nr:CehA/McbA family metallohydrolase [Pyrinomonadaceae bacterium]
MTIRTSTLRLLLAGLSLLALFAAVAGDPPTQQPMAAESKPPRLNWYKGNTHTHTLNSDGDSTPDEVVRWYRENGYNFLVLTDHNFVTSVDGLNALHAADEKFIVIKGEEVTDKFGSKPIHVNGLNVERKVEPQGGNSVVEVLQRNVDAVRAVSGVPHINHPNYEWAITADELKQVQNNKLFEIYNGHHRANNLGGGGAPGLEEVWDVILSNGKLLYGIAVDDAHTFKQPWNKNSARPGRGWVVVRTDRLSTTAILDALERGDFYASTGVELADYQTTEKDITITIKPERSTKYRVLFIGQSGRVLKEAITNPAVYQFLGNEMYVRAKIIDSNGDAAWTQPVWLKRDK